jgi:RimJ/RimL family protein N-acetyltransferase
MIKYRLKPNDFAFLGTEYDVIEITKDNYEEHIHLIEKTIQNFNDEIEWDEMFDLDEAIIRLKNGEFFYIGVIDDEPFGHVWFEFVDTISLNKHAYNLFIKNKVDNKTYSGKEFFSYVIEKYHKCCKIYSEIDEWNIASIKIVEYLGFKKYK